MIEEKIKLNSKLIVVDAFKSGQKQNETPVYEKLLEKEISFKNSNLTLQNLNIQ
jgi:hypothetical protein